MFRRISCAKYIRYLEIQVFPLKSAALKFQFLPDKFYDTYIYSVLCKYMNNVWKSIELLYFSCFLRRNCVV